MDLFANKVIHVVNECSSLNESVYSIEYLNSSLLFVKVHVTRAFISEMRFSF